MTALGLIGQLGLLIVLPILGGVFLGGYLDRLLGGTGLVLIASILMGLAAGLYGAYRLLMQEIPKDHRKEPGQRS